MVALPSTFCALVLRLFTPCTQRGECTSYRGAQARRWRWEGSAVAVFHQHIEYSVAGKGTITRREVVTDQRFALCTISRTNRSFKHALQGVNEVLEG